MVGEVEATEVEEEGETTVVVEEEGIAKAVVEGIVRVLLAVGEVEDTKIVALAMMRNVGSVVRGTKNAIGESATTGGEMTGKGGTGKTHSQRPKDYWPTSIQVLVMPSSGTNATQCYISIRTGLQFDQALHFLCVT